MDWATFWANFSQAHLVTLATTPFIPIAFKRVDPVFINPYFQVNPANPYQILTRKYTKEYPSISPMTFSIHSLSQNIFRWSVKALLA
jgi:hypothetical protein